MAREGESKEGSGAKRYVFDTFAIWAWLSDEPGAGTVQQILEKAREAEARIYVSWVNLAEVYYLALRYSSDRDRDVAALKAIEVIQNLPVELIPVGEAEALVAGRIKAHYPMSLTDAFAAALGKIYGAEVVTGDREFQVLEKAKEVAILWLPAKRRRRT